MRIALLLSGGVDSSVALKLLKDKGHSLTAFYLKIWLEEEADSFDACPWEEDLRYAKAVCEQLSVPLIIVPLQREYRDRIIAYTFSETRLGRTPNPDVLCNSAIKFGAFLEVLNRYGTFDFVATGHYARVQTATADRRAAFDDRLSIEDNLKHMAQDEECETAKNGPGSHSFLLSARDPVKDQTYFLSRLSQTQLSRAMFPIGEYCKDAVRAMAKEWKLPTWNRKDSQGLCFLGKIHYADFLRRHFGDCEGDIICRETGSVLGKHSGHWLYTVGQRHGLHLSGGPWYVSGKDEKKNIIFISHRLSMPEVERKVFAVSNFHFLIPASKCEFYFRNIFVKIRHGEQKYRCKAEYTDEKKSILRVEFIGHKDRGITAGQFAVFYKGAVCIGSGVIEYSE